MVHLMVNVGWNLTSNISLFHDVSRNHGKETHLLILQMVQLFLHVHFDTLSGIPTVLPIFFWFEVRKKIVRQWVQIFQWIPRSPERDVRLDPNVHHFPWRWFFSDFVGGLIFNESSVGSWCVCFVHGSMIETNKNMSTSFSFASFCWLNSPTNGSKKKRTKTRVKFSKSSGKISSTKFKGENSSLIE